MSQDPSVSGGLPPARLRTLVMSLRAVGAAGDVDETLQQIVDCAVEVVEGADVADIMFVRSGEVTTPVSTHEVAADVDRVQQESGEGPCLVALRKQERVVVDDLEEDDRWPTFTGHALALGIRSVAAYRLFRQRESGEDHYGVLNLFGYQPGLGGLDVELGEVFAAHCSAVLANAISQEGVEVALLSHEVIGQAKGILMLRHQLAPDQAYEMLRRASAEHDMDVRVLASQIVTGTSTLD